jgi:two-component system OmpR family sensor kinase
MLRSVRARLTLWYTAVVAVVLIAFSALSYVLLAREIRASTDASLQDTARELAGAVGHDPLIFSGSGTAVALDFRFSDRAIFVFTPAGRLIASSRFKLSPAEQQELAAAVRRGLRGFGTIPGGPDRDGIRLFAMPVTVMGQRYLIVVAGTLDQQIDRLEDARHATFFGIPFALLLASGGGYLLARKALRPVTVMSRQARQIGAETLAARIAVANEGDELAFLAHTLNDLLERLQRSFEMQRRFMADASHELRTPLAVIQGEADVTLSRMDRSVGEYRESVEVMQKSALKLTRIVQNLFLLARTDAGGYPIRITAFYLDELIADCVRALRNIAAGRGVNIEQRVEPDLRVDADEELLHRMILNLLDNALKFTPAGGTVAISAGREGGNIVLRVADGGPGIAPEDQARIFERFYRADRARQPQDVSAAASSGAGLGLPIARWIAEAHGGSLSLERSDGRGSTFTVVLPDDV